MTVVMEKFQGWTPEKSKLYDEAFQKAFEMAEQEYLERKKKQALENKQKQLQQNNSKTEPLVSKSTEAPSEDI